MERDSLGGPDHGWYIAEPDGTTFGPFSRSEFAAQRTRAGYSAQALAWHVDFSEWRPLARVAVSAQSRAGEASRERAAAPTLSTGIDDDYSRPQPQIYRSAETETCIGNAPIAATVRAFDVPFARLVTFFLKAALAAVPGVLLLGVILWFVGAGLELAFPQLIKMKILIGFN